MKLKLNENVLRVALILFSIIFGILSISLIALGIAYFDELWWPKRYVGLDFLELPTMLIVLGSLSLFMAVAGCFCSKSYNRKLLMTFGLVLFLILLLELTIAVIAFINFNEHDAHHSRTGAIMNNEYQSLAKEDQWYFKGVENHFNCCGVDGTESNCNSDDGMFAPKPGCAEVVDKFVRLTALQIGYFSIAMILLQIIQIGFIYAIQDFVYRLL